MSTKVKTPGQLLRTAREELGKSQSDMAKLTRISVQQLQGLEEDHYEKIPAPMYVRGFMKLYAQKLGINHEPLIEMYERMRTGEELNPPDENPAPQPVLDEIFTGDPPLDVHQDAFRDPSPPVRNPDPGFDWRALPAPLARFLKQLHPERFRSPAFKYPAIAVAVLLMLLLGLRSCRGGREQAPDSAQPVVEDPLLSPPEPVYFQLPSSYQ